MGGSGGAAGSSGAGGTPPVPGCTLGTRGGTPDVCSFDIECALAGAIPTVGVIDWSTDLAGLSEARIEFTLDDPAADEINRGSGGEIDIGGTTHRALMLGLKPERTYTYRIVATAGTTTCTSADQKLSTGAATEAPTVTRTVANSAARARGFVVTSAGSPYMFGRDHRMAYIFDADGAVVWWADAPIMCSRARMDWEGANMWMVSTNPGSPTAGQVFRVGMDGTGAETVWGNSSAHHDFTVLPNGVVAFLSWTDVSANQSDLVERLPDGTFETVIRLDENVFGRTSSHANSIHYHPGDDTYTVGDPRGAGFVKLTREGDLLWAFLLDCSFSQAPKCATGDFFGNHGHHLADDGSFFVFNSSMSATTTPAYGYSLTETASSLTASRVWSYSANGVRSAVLGDVQSLPNGNVLVVFSTSGQIHEVSSSGELVQIFFAKTPLGEWDAPFGYASFRETLYGPPSR